MAKRNDETNVQFIKRIMETGSPLRQAFVIEAVARYAEECAAASPEAFDSPLLSGKAWHEIAVQIKAECDDKYGKRAPRPKRSPHDPEHDGC